MYEAMFDSAIALFGMGALFGVIMTLIMLMLLALKRDDKIEKKETVDEET